VVFPTTDIAITAPNTTTPIPIHSLYLRNQSFDPNTGVLVGVLVGVLTGVLIVVDINFIYE
jgi:hypothetical protein